MQKHWQFLPNDIFFKQYKYPCSELLIREFVDLKNILLNLEEKNTYNDISNKVNQWSENLYHDFDASIFGDFLIDKIGKSK
jgi:hypothetical protein